MNLKYVNFELGGPILFGPCFKHSDFMTVGRNDSILSAGFAAIGEDNTVQTYGHSTSLKMKVQEGDARRIWKLINGVSDEMHMSCMVIPDNAFKDDTKG